MKHYKYGGSTAQRTMACPSWVSQAEGIPQPPASSFAETGTRLHDQMERLLNGDIEEGLWETNDQDEIGLLEEALAGWDKLCALYGVADYWVEQTFELNADTGGTADVVAKCADGRTLIVDWKFGQGLAVEAEGNVQALFYAMISEGKKHGYAAGDDLTVVIIQPIPSRGDVATLKTWDVPADVYTAFKRQYIAAQKSTGLSAGSHCRWCPAAATCPEKTGETLRAMTMDPAKLTTLAAALELADDVTAWAKQVKETAHTQLELGNAVEGWKLVSKRGVRKWANPQAAEQAVRDLFVASRRLRVGDITETAFMSAPKLEKVCKAKGVDFGQLSAYVSKTSSGTTLARTSDPREETLSAAALQRAVGSLT